MRHEAICESFIIDVAARTQAASERHSNPTVSQLISRKCAE